MAMNCNQCGAALTERDAFCTKCGARREIAAQPAGARRFCTNCGAPLGETKFCTKCGASAGASAASNSAAEKAREFLREAEAEKSRATMPRPAAPAAAPVVHAAAKSSAGIPKILIAGGAIVVLLVVVVAGGLFYAAHRARQKAAEIEAGFDVNKSIADMAAAANATAKKEKNQANPTPTTASPAPASSPAAIAAASAAADAALVPPPTPEGPSSMAPVAATGDRAHDWALEYERTVGGPEADLVVRTGDINNLGFGWPAGFDPFSGKSTPPHPWPSILQIPAQAPPGTDRIMLGTSVMPVHMSIQHVAGQADRIAVDSVVKEANRSDGYSGSLENCFSIRDGDMSTVTPDWAARCIRQRQLTMPTPIVLSVGELPATIHEVVFQIFVDDFQPLTLHSHFQVSLNGTRIPTFEYAINSLDQTGPIGKLLTLGLLPEYWPLLKSGEAKLLIDDPTTHIGDGYAVDFVRILVNPHKFKYQVSLAARVVDADKHTPIAGATVTAALESAETNKLGKCELAGLPAGLVVATASAPGYDENSTPVDLEAGQKGQAEIQLHRHEESTAALERAISQTGSATIYGIHFDTDSSKLRPDSLPALNAVLGLIKNHAGSRWVIAGHTDNQGAAAHNQTLSEARAESVVTWLKDHGVDVNILVPQGFGATRPVADNATANGRALNRRVEVALAK